MPQPASNEGIPWESGAFSTPPGGAHIRIPSARGSSQGYGRGVACRIPPSAIMQCDAGRSSAATARSPGVTAALAAFRILHSPSPHAMRPMPLYSSPPPVTGMQSAFAPRQREALARGPTARIDAAAGGTARLPASCADAADGHPAPRGRSKSIIPRTDSTVWKDRKGQGRHCNMRKAAPAVFPTTTHVKRERRRQIRHVCGRSRMQKKTTRVVPLARDGKAIARVALHRSKHIGPRCGRTRL